MRLNTMVFIFSDLGYLIVCVGESSIRFEIPNLTKSIEKLFTKFKKRRKQY